MKKKTLLTALLAAFAGCGIAGFAACVTDGEGGGTDDTDKPTAPHSHQYVKSDVKDCANGDYELYRCDCGASYKANEKTPVGHTLSGNECTRCGKPATQSLQIEIAGDKATVTGLGSATDVEDLIIPSSYKGVPVAGIGEEAFSSKQAIKFITLPPSVERIETKAFFNCDGVERIWLAEGLEEIGNSAFGSLESIDKITLPDSLRTIGAQAFAFCNKLTEFTVPKNVESIGVGVVSYDGAMEKVAVADGNVYYKSVNNCLVEITSGKLLGAGNGAKIPDDGSVKEICDEAFANLTGLGAQIIPDSVTVLGEKIFIYSDVSGLTLNADINEFNVNILYGCEHLNKLEINGTNYKYAAKNNCLIDVENKVLVKGCETSVIPDDGSVTEIGYQAFKDCVNLTGIVIPHTVTKIGNYAFANTGLTGITVPSSVVTVSGTSVFSGCNKLENVTIEEGVKEIGTWMFSGCAKLSNVVIPDSVTKIKASAFYGCSQLNTVTLGKNLTTIEQNAFNGCNSLYECYNLSDTVTVTVGNTDKTANGGLDGVVKYLHTDKNEKSKLIVEGEFVFADNEGEYELIGYTGAREDLVLPESCKGKSYVIPEKTFYGSAYKSLKITGGVKEIGKQAFGSCKKLESVYIKGDNLTIGASAFLACSGAKTLTVIADSLTLTDNYSLRMVNLEEITLSNAAIPAQAFYNFTELKKVTLTNCATGDAAFYKCSALTEVTVNGGSIGQQAFYGLSQLNKVTLSDDVSSIGAWAFYQCGLAEVALGNREWTISYDGDDYDITVADGEEAKSLTDYSGYIWTKKL